MTALARLDDEKRDLLARTLCNGASRDEMELFFNICERTGLDPFARQIYAVRRYDKRAGREVMQTQVSIDGFRLVAQRSGEYAGQTSVAYCGTDGRWVDVWLNEEPPAAARVGVYRKGFVEAVGAIALFREYAQRSKDGYLTGMWGKMPTVMIAKCAEALALRKAFPAELSGLYTPEEMGQQDNPPAAPAVPTVAALPAPAPAEVVEAATMPQDAPVAEDAPKPVRKRKAAQEASKAAPAAKDAYPDEYEGLFVIQRVVRRPGKPVAVQAVGAMGTAWIAATVPEYADVCERAIDGELRLAVDRVNGSLTIMRVMALAPKPAAPVAVPADEIDDKSDLPF
jgi:phage recombination protein Bet